MPFPSIATSVEDDGGFAVFQLHHWMQLQVQEELHERVNVLSRPLAGFVKVGEEVVLGELYLWPSEVHVLHHALGSFDCGQLTECQGFSHPLYAKGFVSHSCVVSKRICASFPGEIPKLDVLIIV